MVNAVYTRPGEPPFSSPALILRDPLLLASVGVLWAGLGVWGSLSRARPPPFVGGLGVLLVCSVLTALRASGVTLLHVVGALRMTPMCFLQLGALFMSCSVTG